MYKKIQPHIAYQSLYPFFFPIKVASDGYRRGYVSFAHFLLYLFHLLYLRSPGCNVMQFSLYNDEGYSVPVLALMFDDERVSTAEKNIVCVPL